MDESIQPGWVVSVNVAKMRLIELSGQTVKTGIYKYPIDGRVKLADNQVGADRQGDYEAHGGYDKAAYAYATEDYAWWSAELNRELEPGAFGENLTTEGVDLSGSLCGDRWRLGSALLEVSEPRLPCSKLAHKMGDPKMVRRFAKANRPGVYLRIIEAGEAGSGDQIEVVSRPDHEVSMELMNRAYLGRRELAEQMLEAEALSDGWRRWAEQRLAG